MSRERNVESAETEFPADAYKVRGHGGVAWSVAGWETEPDADTEWSGYESRTGRLACVMIGDDRQWFFDPDDLRPLDETEYCRECGQIGCANAAVSAD